MNNLPVYLDYRSGRSQIVTQIRKIDGDVLVRQTDKQTERETESVSISPGNGAYVEKSFEREAAANSC